MCLEGRQSRILPQGRSVSDAVNSGSSTVSVVEMRDGTSYLACSLVLVLTQLFTGADTSQTVPPPVSVPALRVGMSFTMYLDAVSAPDLIC